MVLVEQEREEEKVAGVAAVEVVTASIAVAKHRRSTSKKWLRLPFCRLSFVFRIMSFIRLRRNNNSQIVRLSFLNTRDLHLVLQVKNRYTEITLF